MKLKCQLKGVKCPPYSHEGQFHPNDTTIARLLPDLRRCANCIAYEPPSLPAFRDDLIQIASITLLKKGPAYNPAHESRASFGTFIRPRICGSLIYAKSKELIHHTRECTEAYMALNANVKLNSEDERYIDFIQNVADVNAECFVDEFIWEVFVGKFEEVLPQLLKVLTHRERQVFTFIRGDKPNCEIAKMLKLSPPRISQLVRNIERKLREACQKFRLIE